MSCSVSDSVLVYQQLVGQFGDVSVSQTIGPRVIRVSVGYCVVSRVVDLWVKGSSVGLCQSVSQVGIRSYPTDRQTTYWPTNYPEIYYVTE